MKRIIAIPLSIIVILTGMFSSVHAAPKNQTSLLNDTISGATAIVSYETWLEGSYSTMDVTISNVSNGAGLGNGVYTGWCIQDGISGELRGQQATLYNSLSSNLPSDIAALPWNEINYVLNHKIRGAGKTDLQFAKDIQSALWILTGAADPEFGISAEAQRMVEEANKNPEYTPSTGDLFAVIIYSDGFSQTRRDRIQEAIIEVKLTAAPTQTPTLTASPSETSTFPSNTPTGTVATPTNTPTGTITPPTNTPTATNTPVATFSPTSTLSGVCTPTVVIANFANIPTGSSIEGMGVVVPNLNIDAKGTAVKVSPLVAPTAYFGTQNGISVLNYGIPTTGGFTDITTRDAGQAHLYNFTFAPGVSVNNFSLRMLDFGDLNPTLNINHYAGMTAYNSAGVVVSKQELRFVTLPDLLPQSSDLYGNLSVTGDASAPFGQPGNWTWMVSGPEITRVTLEFGAGFDPNIAFDTLKYCLATP